MNTLRPAITALAVAAVAAAAAIATIEILLRLIGGAA